MKTYYLSLLRITGGFPQILLRAALLSIVFLLSLPDNSAQEIRTFDKGDNTYLIGQEVYKYREMGELFAYDQVQTELYQQSLVSLNRVRTAGIVGAVGVGFGLIGMASSGCEDGKLFCIPTKPAMYMVSAITLPIAAMMGGLSYSRYASKKKELFQLYNNDHAIGQLPVLEAPVYTISAASSGLGIAIQF